MVKKDLITAVNRRVDSPLSLINIIADEMMSVIIEELQKGNEVSIRGFGSFKPKERKARKGYNFKTHEETNVPSRKVVKFKSYITLD